jgi:rhodanese-related sulfurtransferase
MLKLSWSPLTLWIGRVPGALTCLVLAGGIAVVPLVASAAAAEPPAVESDVAREALWEMLFAEKPPVVVDVRKAEQFAKFRLPRSQNLREPEAIAGLRPEEAQPIILVGDTEDQARAVGTRLKALGRPSRVLRGGLRKWPYGLEMNAEELRGRLQKEQPPKLVDVRTAEEYGGCRIKATLHRPLDQIETWGPTLSPDEEVVLVCRTARRSGLAQEWLARHGFKHVHNLIGGTVSWPYGWVGGRCPP